MSWRELAVAGAVEFTAPGFADERGRIVVPCHQDEVTAALGAPLFPVAQTIHSVSGRDVARGVHYTGGRNAMAKYVYCLGGRALDLVVDLRVGSPTFGRWDAVLLDPADFRAVYLPVGVGHAFVALSEHTVMHYLLSETYQAHREHAVHLRDPELGLPLPADRDLVLSARDAAAPTLAEALAAGALPQDERSREVEGTMR